MSGRKLAVLLLTTVGGAFIAGVPGALVGYLVGMVGSAFIPALQGGSCDVTQTEPERDAETSDRDRTAA